MPSRRSAVRALVGKEWRELLASRAWWVMVAAVGPLTGVSFISAVQTYGELSGVDGAAAGVGEAFSPLVGIWAPTFSALELAAAFLLPFVAIRLVAGDRQSGALAIELQHRTPAIVRVAIKALVLLAGWLIASGPALIAVLLWVSYGGTVHVPEIATVALGHVLNASLTIALATAAAALTEHPSTAAILTLGVTVGTWILNFAAAIHGGLWERAALFTPTAMVAEFQRGLIRLDVLLAAAALAAGGLTLGAIWLRLGVAVRHRLRESVVLAAALTAAVAAAASVTGSWDTSEDRRNSFSVADEAALRAIREPVHVEAHLAAQDPRRVDLEQHTFRKLRRVVPAVEVRYVAATTTGLFEQSRSDYGEVWYDVGGRRAMNRTTNPEGILATIYGLAGVARSADTGEDVFRGHPLAARPRGAAAIFYGLWPAAAIAAAFFLTWRHS